MTNVIIEQFPLYNPRRYSAPWVCIMTDKYEYDFETRVGMYTGDRRKGEAGDLVVFEPKCGCVYAYGQKDNRGNNSKIEFALWDGAKFVPCDKLGRAKEPTGADVK